MNYIKILAITVSVIFAIGRFSMPNVQAEEATPVLDDIEEFEEIEEIEELEEVDEVEETEETEEVEEVEEVEEIKDLENVEEIDAPISSLHIKIYQAVEIPNLDGNITCTSFLANEMNLVSQEATTLSLVNEALSSCDFSDSILAAINTQETIPEICPEDFTIIIEEDIHKNIVDVKLETENTDEK